MAYRSALIWTTDSSHHTQWKPEDSATDVSRAARRKPSSQFTARVAASIPCQTPGVSRTSSQDLLTQPSQDYWFSALQNFPFILPHLSLQKKLPGALTSPPNDSTNCLTTLSAPRWPESSTFHIPTLLFKNVNVTVLQKSPNGSLQHFEENPNSLERHSQTFGSQVAFKLKTDWRPQGAFAHVDLSISIYCSRNEKWDTFQTQESASLYPIKHERSEVITHHVASGKILSIPFWSQLWWKKPKEILILFWICRPRPPQVSQGPTGNPPWKLLQERIASEAQLLL